MSLSNQGGTFQCGSSPAVRSMEKERANAGNQYRWIQLRWQCQELTGNCKDQGGCCVTIHTPMGYSKQDLPRNLTNLSNSVMCL